MEAKFKYKILANVGGYAIIEQDGKLIFVNYGTSWLYTFNFILIILCVVTFTNGIIQFIMNNMLAGMLLSSTGIVAVLLLVIGIRVLKKSKKKPLEKITIICMVDLITKEFLNKNGQLLVSLDVVRFGRVMQLFSSFYAIQAEWSGGKMIVLRGNPFAGGSAGFIDVLKKNGLMK